MKKRLLTFVFSLFISASLFAQAEAVDIQKMVDQQIEQAKEKESAAQIKTEQPTKKTTESSFVTRIQYFGGAVLLITFALIARRQFISFNVRRKNKMKKSVSMIRSERIPSKVDVKLKLIRKKLSQSDYSGRVKGKDVTKLAKYLNITQGEIQLAAKLKTTKAHNMVKRERPVIVKRKNAVKDDINRMLYDNNLLTIDG